MKRLKTIFATAVLSVGLIAGVSSCSDKNEDEPAVPAAKEIAGTYEGDMICSVMGQESTFEGMTYTVTAEDDTNVTVSVSSFGNPPMQVPGFSIEGVKVSGTDGTYTLAATNFSGDANGKAFSGVLKGSYAEKELTVEFTLNYGAMPMPMICTFTAPKK